MGTRSKALRRGRALLEQIDDLAKQPKGLADELATLKKKLSTLLDAPAPAASGAEPPLNLAGPTNEAGELYSHIDRADAAPTKAQLAAAEHLAEESREGIEAWEKLLSRDVAKLNEQLKAASLPELKINSASKQADQTDGGDDDDLG